MDEIKIYLDTCCYNRPYDVQDNIIVNRETTAKLLIQSLVKYKSLQLVSSFILAEEITKISSLYKRNNIWGYIEDYSSYYVSNRSRPQIEEIASSIIETGVKKYDALHVACALYAKCNYFISTDKRLLKYKSDSIKLLNPVDFVHKWEGSR
jgi:predicted nucleic acid-binding protein